MITRQARSQIGEMPIKLPLFFSRSKPPKSFATTAVVGLRIVAAMGNSTEQPNTLTSAAVPTPSSPIPITPATSTWKGIQVVEEEEELSESYTCVISHVGKEYVKKRMYYKEADDDNMVMNMDIDTDTKMDATIHRRCDKDEPSLFYHSSPATPVATLRFDFLEFCCGCRKRLEGIDIFMYRGEKAFCSTDCRHHQIMADEYHEKFASKSHKPFDCPASPCSAPMFLAAGVAAA